jgi:pimeloyl-ACP methyl ester carboxylesterase
MSGLAVLFLAVDAIGKVLRLSPYVQGTVQVGFPQSAVAGLGLVELAAVVLYLVPRTSMLGAVLLTGWLGGAIATHARMGSPLFSHTLFPIYVAVLIWGGLYLRVAALRALVPLRTRVTAARAEAGAPAKGARLQKVISTDGAPIAYEKSGAGPAVILVDGALCSRAFGPMPKLARLLAPQFTVFNYDRRGRGDSGDVQPYAREREVEDIAALVEAAGGSAHLVGLSSGAALALEAAAAGLGIGKVAAYEPPYIGGDSRAGAEHQGRLEKLIAEGRRGDAVKYFMRDMVGVPGVFVVLMQLMFGVWRKLKAVAHTLPYDAAVMGDFTVPVSRLRAIRTPTLVMHGSKTDARLKNAADAVAEAVPNARHLTLAGQTHNVNPEVLTRALVEFLRG